jgi:hypothetical protein
MLYRTARSGTALISLHPRLLQHIQNSARDLTSRAACLAFRPLAAVRKKKQKNWRSQIFPASLAKRLFKCHRTMCGSNLQHTRSMLVFLHPLPSNPKYPFSTSTFSTCLRLNVQGSLLPLLRFFPLAAAKRRPEVLISSSVLDKKAFHMLFKCHCTICGTKRSHTKSLLVFTRSVFVFTICVLVLFHPFPNGPRNSDQLAPCSW